MRIPYLTSLSLDMKVSGNWVMSTAEVWFKWGKLVIAFLFASQHYGDERMN